MSSSPASFGTRLRRALDIRGPLCVGIDPHSYLLRQWGLDDSADGAERFTRTVIEALADRVAVLKPQSAFYERFGSRGLAVLERCLPQARAAGALVLFDVKRGDIGSTMEAYADAYLDPASPLAVDAITVSSYLGTGANSPVFEVAQKYGGGAFVLALTSNPEGQQVQSARTPDGSTVADTVLADVAARNAGAETLGSVGVVVGATVGSVDFDLSSLNGPILVPGLGAQGGTADDLTRLFGSAARNVLPAQSRSVLGAGPDIARLREAAQRDADGFARALAG